MMLKNMLKRIGAYLIDYLSISLLLFILCLMWGTLPMFDAHGDYPFIMISFVYLPWLFWYNMLAYQGGYGDISWIWGVFIICIIVESIVYSIQEYRNGQTFGKKVLRIMIKDVGDKKISFCRIFARNVLKITSKFLLGVPFFLSCFFKDKAIYDIFTKIIVCDVRNKQ